MITRAKDYDGIPYYKTEMYKEIARLRERVEELETEIAYRNEQREMSLEALCRSELNIPHWLVPVVALFLSRDFVRHSTIDFIGDERDRSEFTTFHSLAVHHLRKRLQGTGVEITTVWGQGYTINAESQKRLRELVYRGQH